VRNRKGRAYIQCGDKDSLENAAGCFKAVMETKSCDEGILYMIDVSAQTTGSYIRSLRQFYVRTATFGEARDGLNQVYTCRRLLEQMEAEFADHLYRSAAKTARELLSKYPNMWRPRMLLLMCLEKYARLPTWFCAHCSVSQFEEME
jgi:hypothetical protein